MFANSVRAFSTGRIVLRRAPVAPISSLVPGHPRYAAKLFIEAQNPKHAKSIRRKERKLQRRIIRDVNNLKKYDETNKPFEVDPVLGQGGFMERIKREVANQDTRLAGGFDREEFEALVYGAEKAALDKAKGSSVLHEATKLAEERKKRALMTILHLRNTSVADKKKLAVKLAREEFSRSEGDSGSPEVQAAVMTVKIHFGMDHVRANKKDHEFTQYIRQLVQQRQRILKYLKRVRPEDYYLTIARLGLTDDVITREFPMGRQYFEDYKVWGEKKLIKHSDKVKKKMEQVAALRKKVSDYHEVAKEKFVLYKNSRLEKEKKIELKKLAKEEARLARAKLAESSESGNTNTST
ncbi:uncharacterized protein RJT21DRAFT_121107 [Scheffersomyces amazonensis]|uniref:uncharacterized protein n=1 Tax=Scheffersomyces amazonensis TaxID=1078765 RepID=UPI00315D225B